MRVISLIAVAAFLSLALHVSADHPGPVPGEFSIGHHHDHDAGGEQSYDERFDHLPLHHDADGHHHVRDRVTYPFWTCTRAAGVPKIRLHDLRHTHATLMLKAGVNPKVVSERLGHSSVNITLDTYSHVLPGLQEDAALQFSHLLASREGKY